MKCACTAKEWGSEWATIEHCSFHAAAPELLWAAKWAVYALEHGSSVEVHWLQTVAKENHARALEAIAKAEGRTP